MTSIQHERGTGKISLRISLPVFKWFLLLKIKRKFRINFLCQQWHSWRKKGLTVVYWCFQGRGCCSAQQWSKKGRIYLSWFYWFPFSGPEGLLIMWVSSTSPSIRVFQSIHTDKKTRIYPNSHRLPWSKNVFTCLDLGNFFSAGNQTGFQTHLAASTFLHIQTKPSTGVKRQWGDETCVAKGHIQPLALPWHQPPFSVLDFVSCLEKGQRVSLVLQRTEVQIWPTNRKLIQRHKPHSFQVLRICFSGFLLSLPHIFS